MATDALVKQLLEDELKDRAPEQFAEAGDNWSKLSLDFFFPENEHTVDLCVLQVLDDALKEDGTTVPKKVRNNVARLIGTTTKVKEAIIIIALTTLQPTPKNQ
jgi:hypothetical protein